MQKLPPKVETHKTKMDVWMDIFGLAFFVASLVYTIFQWSNLPDEVPMHFNIAGEVDSYGSPVILLLLPMIGAGLFAFLEFLERHPEWHNYPSRLDETNAARFYQASRTLMNRMKCITLILFAYIQWEITRIGIGATVIMSNWIFGGLIALLLGVLIIGVVRQSKIK